MYPALKRLELKGWIASKWETTERNRRAKVYRLTAAGRKQLHQERSEWADFVRAVARVMKPTGESDHDLEATALPAAVAPTRRRARHARGAASLASMAAPGELGNLTLAAEDARAEWGWTRLEQLGQDLRYACRTLRKSPVFAATTVLSLAIGIGATTSLFTLIDAVMWKLLPVANPEQLLVLTQRGPTGVFNGFSTSSTNRARSHPRLPPRRLRPRAAQHQHRRACRAHGRRPAGHRRLFPAARGASGARPPVRTGRRPRGAGTSGGRS